MEQENKRINNLLTRLQVALGIVYFLFIGAIDKMEDHILIHLALSLVFIGITAFWVVVLRECNFYWMRIKEGESVY